MLNEVISKLARLDKNVQSSFRLGVNLENKKTLVSQDLYSITAFLKIRRSSQDLDSITAFLKIRRSSQDFKIKSGISPCDVYGYCKSVVDSIPEGIFLSNKEDFLAKAKAIKDHYFEHLKDVYKYEGYRELAEEDTNELFQRITNLELKIRNPDFRREIRKIDKGLDFIKSESDSNAVLVLSEIDSIRTKIKEVVSKGH